MKLEEEQARNFVKAWLKLMYICFGIYILGYVLSFALLFYLASLS